MTYVSQILTSETLAHDPALLDLSIWILSVKNLTLCSVCKRRRWWQSLLQLFLTHEVTERILQNATFNSIGMEDNLVYSDGLEYQKHFFVWKIHKGLFLRRKHWKNSNFQHSSCNYYPSVFLKEVWNEQKNKFLCFNS